MTKKEKEILGIVEDCLKRKSGSTRVVIDVTPEGTTTVEAATNLKLTFDNDDEYSEEDESDEAESFEESNDELVEKVEEVVEEEEVPDFKSAAKKFVASENEEKVPPLSELVNRF